jgi:uncharacterized protein (UPF0335 family)
MEEEILCVFNNVLVQQDPGTFKKETDVKIVKFLRKNLKSFPIYLHIEERFKIPLTKMLLVLKESKYKYILFYKDIYIHLTFPMFNYFFFKFSFDEKLYKFEILLSVKTNLRLIQHKDEKNKKEEKPKLVSIGQNISDFIEISSDFFATTVDMASNAIINQSKSAGKYLKDNLDPFDSPIKINSSIKSTIEAGEELGKSLNKYTDQIYETILSNSSSYGSKIIKPLCQTLRKQDQESSEEMKTIKKIFTNTAEGMDRITTCQEKSITKITDGITETVVDILRYKFGEEFGECTRKTTTMIRETSNAYLKIRNFSSKGLMKDSMKQILSSKIRSKL